MTDISCGKYFVTTCFFVVILIVTEDGKVLVSVVYHGYSHAISAASIALRVYTLWGRQKSVMVIIWIGFAITYTGVLIAFVMAVRDIHGTVLASSVQL